MLTCQLMREKVDIGLMLHSYFSCAATQVARCLNLNLLPRHTQLALWHLAIWQWAPFEAEGIARTVQKHGMTRLSATPISPLGLHLGGKDGSYLPIYISLRCSEKERGRPEDKRKLVLSVFAPSPTRRPSASTHSWLLSTAAKHNYNSSCKHCKLRRTQTV